MTAKHPRGPSGDAWNAANLVTYSRIVVTPLFLVLIFRPEVWAKWTGGILFAWGAYSDYLDGYLARRYHLRTDVGALIDPLADKILFLSAMLAFVQMQWVPAWMVAVIMAREFLITGLRQYAQSRKIVLAASRAGKHKTVSQIVAISVILAIVCVRATVEQYERWELALARMGALGDWIWEAVLYGPYWLMFYATVVSIISGYLYVARNRYLFSRGKT
jgi:CDP-diacylglycerol--glycerol-3-phosphate 3-phosphatidyltransferase